MNKKFVAMASLWHE